MAAGSIIIDLLMRTGSFETDTKRASARLKELERSAKQVGAAIGTAFVAAATATVAFVKSSIDAADAAYKNAQSIGLTVEAYTALAFAADLSGVSQEDMGTSLTRLARLAAEAAGGSKTAGAAFASMGIQIKNASGAIKDTDTLLGEIATKFASYADGTEKTALATELFGRSGAKLIPLLNAGAAGIDKLKQEAAELGIVMDTQTAKAAEQFNDDLSRLGAVVRGFGNDLMRAALPSLQAVASSLLDLRRNSADAGDGLPILTAMFNGLALEAARSSTQIYVLGVQMAEFAAKAELVGRGLREMVDGSNTSNVEIARRTWAGFRAISEGVKADTDRARAELAAFERRLAEGPGVALTGARLNAQTDPRSLTLGKAPALARAPTLPSGGGSTGAKSADRAAQYTEQLRKQLEGTQDLTAAEKVLADIRAGSLGRVTAAQEQTLLGLAREIDATKEAQRVARERADARNKENEAIERWARENEEADRQRLKSLTSGTESARLKEATADIRFLNEQYDKGNISVEAWADAIRKSTAELGAQAQALDTFTQQAAENFQSFLGGALADAFEGNFNDIGKGFTRMINRMVAEALAADIARKMFGGDAKGGSGEGWIGAALSWAGSMFGGAKAGGGDVMPGREYWVGERGPERFRPRSMGTILPAGAGPSPAGRSFQQTLNISVQGQVTARTAAQIGAEAGRALRRAERMNA